MLLTRAFAVSLWICAASSAGAQAIDGDGRGLDQYVGSATCATCHEAETSAWMGSHHQLAWTVPSPETVVADFNGTVFEGSGMRAEFGITPEGGYTARVTEADGVTTDHEIHSVAGIAPLQQYLIETEPGRLQSFDIVWDVEEERWYHLYPDQDYSPADALHWTGPYKNWNARCAECHVTGYDKNFDPATQSYASTEVEIGVGCEACHGPGQAHVEWAESLAITQDAPAPANYGFSADFSSTESTIQQCATCHSRREAQLDGNPLPGTPYSDAYTLSLLFPGLYHADGQILEEVYVYGSFLQSKMYDKGVGCLDCHNAHTAERISDTNALCTQCHSPAGNAEFPTLRKVEYDTPDHHFHEVGSEGAQCKSCHMIERVYMGIDGRRDHSFRIPRPDLSLETGSPNACTDCHSDRSAIWAARTIEDWFPDDRNRGPHYGQVLAQGRQSPAAAALDLVALAQDTALPGIVRATALWMLKETRDPSMADRVEGLLDDPDPLVRSQAVSLQTIANAQDRVLRATAALDDPVRSVRTEAAKAMIGAPVARLPGNLQADLQRAIRDWQTALGNRADFPETHIVLAGIGLTTRDFAFAERSFREAVRLDPQRSDAWVMLIRLAEATRGTESAQAVALEALEANPGDLTILDFAAALGVFER